MITKSGLENRMDDPRGAEEATEAIERVKHRDRKAEPEDATVLDPLRVVKEAFAERIAAAKQVQPTDHDRHCLDCFERGRNAAIRVIEGAA